MQWSALIVLVALVGGTAVQYQLASSTADAVLEQRQASSLPCPPLGTHIRPTQIHLQPTLIQHQNWVDFPVPRRFAGRYAFCLDDRVLSTGMGALDFSSGAARFHVATHSIDLNWLTGNLDTLRDPNRWDLRLDCAANFTCQ